MNKYSVKVVEAGYNPTGISFRVGGSRWVTVKAANEDEARVKAMTEANEHGYAATKGSEATEVQNIV